MPGRSAAPLYPVHHSKYPQAKEPRAPRHTITAAQRLSRSSLRQTRIIPINEVAGNLNLICAARFRGPVEESTAAPDLDGIYSERAVEINSLDDAIAESALVGLRGNRVRGKDRERG